MSKNYDFDAPQYLDFSKGFDDSDGADTFFDVESEEPSHDNKENEVVTSVEESCLKRTIKTEPIDNLDVQPKQRVVVKAVRRVSSGLPFIKEEIKEGEENLSEGLNELSFKAKKRTHFENMPLKEEVEKEHSMILRSDKKKIPRLGSLKHQVNGFDAVQKNHKRKSLFNVSEAVPKKYVAMAEQIYHLQNDTPPRFRTSRRFYPDVNQNKSKPHTTTAKTPKLLTAQRTRPEKVLSRDQKEELEIEEMKKHKISALPLNENIFQPPKLPQKVEKAATVPEPFALSEVFKRPAPVADEEPYKFTARPLPKAILKGPVGIGHRPEIPITIPKSPAITKSARFLRPVRVAALSIDNKIQYEDVSRSSGLPVKQNAAPKTTEVIPFSFETRTKEMYDKKERKIKEILEAEKKAREFRANPAPVFDPPKEVIRSARISSMNVSKISVSDMEEQSHNPFKARSPKVLRKPAFKPVVDHAHSEPVDIQMRTEQRAKERREFEMKQMERVEQITLLKEEMALEKKLKEEEEIAKMRKEMVHKANPMPQFKSPPKLASSLVPLTDPKSPNFTKRVRKHKH